MFGFIYRRASLSINHQNGLPESIHRLKSKNGICVTGGRCVGSGLRGKEDMFKYIAF